MKQHETAWNSTFISRKGHRESLLQTSFFEGCRIDEPVDCEMGVPQTQGAMLQSPDSPDPAMAAMAIAFTSFQHLSARSYSWHSWLCQTLPNSATCSCCSWWSSKMRSTCTQTYITIHAYTWTYARSLFKYIWWCSMTRASNSEVTTVLHICIDHDGLASDLDMLGSEVHVMDRQDLGAIRDWVAIASVISVDSWVLGLVFICFYDAHALRLQEAVNKVSRIVQCCDIMLATILFYLYSRYCRIASRHPEAKIAQSNLILEVDAVEQAVARKGLKCCCCIYFCIYCLVWQLHCTLWWWSAETDARCGPAPNPQFSSTSFESNWGMTKKLIMSFSMCCRLGCPFFSVLWSSEKMVVLEPVLVLVLPLLLLLVVAVLMMS